MLIQYPSPRGAVVSNPRFLLCLGEQKAASAMAKGIAAKSQGIGHGESGIFLHAWRGEGVLKYPS